MNSKGGNLRAWPLLLATEEGVEGHVGDLVYIFFESCCLIKDLTHLADLKSDSGNITNSVTLTSETADQHLIVLLDKVQATVIGDEGGDLLAVLDQLHTNALPDGRVGLLSLNADLLENNSLWIGYVIRNERRTRSEENQLLMKSVRCGNCQHNFSEAEPVEFIIIGTMTVTLKKPWRGWRLRRG